MSDDLHAIGILGVAACGLGFLLWDFGRAKGWRPLAAGIAALGMLGLASFLLLNARGAPLIEWLLPLAVFVLVGPLLKSPRTQALFGAVMFAAALVLCINLIELIQGNYAVSLDSATAAKNRAILHTAAKKIEALPAGQLPAGPVDRLLNGPLSKPTVVSPQPLWHTWFTRLRERRPATVWSPGGDVAFVAKNLEVRSD